MIIAKQLVKLQNLAKTSPFFRFSTEHTTELEGVQQRVQKPKLKNVAIILSGCGVQDGTEVTEAVSLMVHLNKSYVTFQCFAPNQNQLHVVNHLNGETTNETRNVLTESARIARGEVKDLAQLKAEDYQAVFLPGGFGVAKNLSDYAVKGGNFSVHTEVERVLKEFHSLKKPIGAMCISPLLIAKVFQGQKPKITMGRVDQDSKAKYWPHSDAIGVAEQLGAEHNQRQADKFQVDFDNKLVTVPAMMFNGYKKFSTTFDGAESLVKVIEQMVLGNPIKIENFLKERKEFEPRQRREGSENQYQDRSETRRHSRKSHNEDELL